MSKITSQDIKECKSVTELLALYHKWDKTEASRRAKYDDLIQQRNKIVLEIDQMEDGRLYGMDDLYNNFAHRIGEMTIKETK